MNLGERSRENENANKVEPKTRRNGDDGRLRGQRAQRWTVDDSVGTVDRSIHTAGQPKKEVLTGRHTENREQTTQYMIRRNMSAVSTRQCSAVHDSALKGFCNDMGRRRGYNFGKMSD